MLFPLAGRLCSLHRPVAAIGLYEMSRRREQGREVSWADAFRVLATPAFGAIVVLGLVLFALFLLWLVTAGNGNTVHFTILMAAAKSIRMVGCGVRGRSL